MVCCSCWSNCTTDTTSSSSQRQSQQQLRRYRTVMIVKGIFLLLGIGILIPWNAFISATNYFNNRLTAATSPTSEDTNKTTATNTTFVSIFAIIFNISSVLTLGLLIFRQSLYKPKANNNKRRNTNEQIVLLQQSPQQPDEQEHNSTVYDFDDGSLARDVSANQRPNNEYGMLRSTDSKHAVDTNNHYQTTNETRMATATNPTMSNSTIEDNVNTRSEHTTTTSTSFWLLGIIPFTIYFLVFLIQSLMVLILDIPPNTFLTITILCLILCGACSVMAQSGIVALAAIFSNSDLAMSPYLEGQAYGGVAVSIANFIASSYSDPSIYWHLHCTNNSSTATNTTDIITLSNSKTNDEWEEEFSMLTTVDRIILTKSSISTSLYTTIDWGTFVYFFAGSITLLVCLFGYMYVHQLSHSMIPIDDDDANEQAPGAATILTATNTFEDRYETVRSHDNLDELVFSASNNKQSFSLLSSSELISSSYNNPAIQQGQQQHGISSSEDHTTFLFMQRANSNGFGKGLELKSTFTTETLNGMPLDSGVEVDTGTKVDGDGIFRTNDKDDRRNGSTAAASTRIVEDHFPHNNENNNSTVLVWLLVQGPTICIYMTFLITLSLFPGLTSQLGSIHRCNDIGSNQNDNSIIGLAMLFKERLYNDLYTPMTFVLFNVGDLVGRIVASSFYETISERLSRLSYKLVLCSLLRFLFIPLLFLCTTTNDHNNKQNQGTDDNTSQSASSWYIPSDFYSILVQFIFATSNGFLLSMAFIHAPRLLIVVHPHPPDEPSPQQLHDTQHYHHSSKSSSSDSNSGMDFEEKMSELLNFAVSFGLLSGSLLSYPVSKVAAN